MRVLGIGMFWFLLLQKQIKSSHWNSSDVANNSQERSYQRSSVEVSGGVASASVNADDRWSVAFEDEPRTARIASLRCDFFVRVRNSAHSIGFGSDVALVVGDDDVVSVLQEPRESSRADASKAGDQHLVPVEPVVPLQVGRHADGVDGVGESDRREQTEEVDVLIALNIVDDAPGVVTEVDLH